MVNPPPVLEIDRIAIDVPAAGGGRRRVVDGLSLEIATGERVALVGESGSGKSLTALAAIALLPEGVELAAGRALVAGTDLATAEPETLRRLRGGTVGFLPQEPSGWLNPVLSVGFQLVETLRCHHRLDRREARRRALDLLVSVALPEPAAVLPAYPHQLSGGESQRVALALALAGEPRLLVADEPTTALDLTTQARILALVASVSAERGLALLLISHDLAVVSGLVEQVLVIYAGEIVEAAATSAVFSRPLHPYTRLLLAAATGPVEAVGGETSQTQATGGCRFAPRCPLARPDCRTEHPALVELADGRRLRCPVTEAELTA
jgi:oligopeptide/dipeptide ABC transporter ATP-binding protein